MKRYTILTLMILATAGILIFNACKKTDEPEPAKDPVLNIIKPSGAQTVDFGAVVNYEVTAAPNATTSSKIKSFRVQVSYDGAAAADAKVFNTDKDSTTGTGSATVTFPSTLSSYTFLRAMPARTIVGTEKWIFTVTDNDGKTASKDVMISVKAPADTVGAAINAYTGKIIGDQCASEGSYFDAKAGTVYGGAAGCSNIASLDLCFRSNQLMSIKERNAISGICSGTGPFNETKISEISMTPTQFDAITGDYKIKISNNNPTSQTVTISVGKVYFFSTSTNKLGLIKINSTQASNGTSCTSPADPGKSVTIEVKVQK